MRSDEIMVSTVLKKQWLVVVMASIGFMATLVAISYWVMQSPWFLIGVGNVSSENSQIVLGGSAVDDKVMRYVTTLPLAIRVPAQLGQTFVYSEINEGKDQVFISFVGWQGKQEVLQALREVGLGYTSSFGPIVVGSSTQHASIGVKDYFRGYSSMVLHKAKHSLDYFPAAVVSASGAARPYLETDLVGVMLRDQPHGFILISQKGSRSFAELRPANRSDEFQLFSDYSTVMSVTAEGLDVLPESMALALNQYILEQLMITYTTPDILQNLLAGSSVALIEDHRGFLLAVSGLNSERRAEVQRFIRNEAAYDYPQKKAFLLPDGTLGYQYVPNIEAVTLEYATDEKGCVRSDVHGQSLWVCENKGSDLYFTTSQELVPVAEELISSGMQIIHLEDKDALREILPVGIEGFTAHIKQDSLVVYVR